MQGQDNFIQLVQQKEILRNFSRILNAGYDLDKLMGGFINLLQDLLKVGKIAVLLQENGSFRIKAHNGIPQDIAEDMSFPVKEGLINYLSQEGTAVRLDFIKPLDPVSINQMRALGVTAAVPAWEHGRLKAVVVFNNKIIGTSVTDAELELVFALGGQLAVAVENASLIDLISSQRNYLESVLRNVSSAVISADCNSIVTTYNPKAEEILGISREEVIGKSVNALPHDIAVLMKEAVVSGTPVFRKELKLSSSGKSIGVSITAVRDTRGKITGSVMIFTDLTRIRMLEEQARRSDRLDFVNTVAMRSSHELKNCLVSIKTFAQLLPERYVDKQFREDFYMVVNKEVDRLNQLVENLLFFAQPLKLDYSAYNIKDAVGEVIDMLDKENMTKHIIIDKEFNNDIRILNMDVEAIRRVFRNILYNSIQAMPKGGKITISACDIYRDAKKYLEIKIIDEGPGIPGDVIDKIWDPFFTTKTRGIGLGLTIVKKIIEEHKGDISIINSGGAEITIYLPYNENCVSPAEKLYFPSGRAVVV